MDLNYLQFHNTEKYISISVGSRWIINIVNVQDRLSGYATNEIDAYVKFTHWIDFIWYWITYSRYDL